ncbi:MAG: TfoX/Sxy family protein [Desulfobacterales bacterium]|jgi:TfoX/Sxy family transcriptional regulator of competence genes
MPYNEEIDTRIKNVVSNWKNRDAKKMFGGVCHLLNGNMFCGVYKDYLILRLGGEKAQEVLKSPFARPFDITGKPMKGWVMLEEDGFATANQLKDWLTLAIKFAETLPPK